jgi:hypothetical protein
MIPETAPPNHANDPQVGQGPGPLPVNAVESGKALMAMIAPTVIAAADGSRVIYDRLFVCTGTALIDFHNSADGNTHTLLVQFDLPDPVPTPGQTFEAMPLSLVFNHPGFAPRPGVTLSVRDDFTATVSPASFSSLDIPSVWAVNWCEAHYSDTLLTTPPPGSGRIALTAQLALQGSNDSGQTSLTRLAYQVTWLAYPTHGKD